MASIGREIIEEVDRKVSRLNLPHNASIRRALVYDGNLVKSVEADGYFDVLIPIRKLLGL